MKLSNPYTRLTLVFILGLAILFWLGFIQSLAAMMVLVWVVYSIEYMEHLEAKQRPRPPSDDD